MKSSINDLIIKSFDSELTLSFDIQVHSPHTTRVPHVRCTVWSRAFLFSKNYVGIHFLFFILKKMRKSLVSREKRVKSDDRIDKRVLSI